MTETPDREQSAPRRGADQAAGGAHRPLWYAAWAFRHTRNAGSAMIVGVALAAVFDVTAF